MNTSKGGIVVYWHLQSWHWLFAAGSDDMCCDDGAVMGQVVVMFVVMILVVMTLVMVALIAGDADGRGTRVTSIDCGGAGKENEDCCGTGKENENCCGTGKENKDCAGTGRGGSGENDSANACAGDDGDSRRGTVHAVAKRRQGSEIDITRCIVWIFFSLGFQKMIGLLSL